MIDIVGELIIEKLKVVLEARHLKHTGRPITTDFNQFFDALFFIVESGSQTRYVKRLFGIPKTTFNRYLKIVIESHILINVYNEIIKNNCSPKTLITDTFIVKSMRGSEGLGRNPTDRGRKGLKVSLICDIDRVTQAVHIGSANKSDTKLLIQTIDKYERPTQLVECLADAGYVGCEVRNQCRIKNYRMIVKPRNTSKKGKQTHVLSKRDAELLRAKRNQIELLNGQIRRFKSLMIKWVRNISTYECFLYVALLCITCYQLFVINKRTS